jgi:predicted O-methyltransferase YrrM
MAHTVVAAIEQLRTLNVIALQKKYQQVFGDASKSSNKQYLFRRIAWRLRANAEGGL